MKEVTNTTTNISSTVSTLTPLDLISCGNSNFNYSNSEEYAIKGVSNFMCIKNKSALAVGGTYTA